MGKGDEGMTTEEAVKAWYNRETTKDIKIKGDEGMTVKEKSVTWEITFTMPAKYNLDSVADRIVNLVNLHAALPDIRIEGFFLVKESEVREVIK